MKTDNLKWFKPLWQAAAVFGCLLVTALVLASCSSTSGGTSTATAVVHTHLSDPATCKAPTGPFSHVYVTITDVEANVSSSAGASDSGWVDLTPGLKSRPKQI